MIVRMVTRCRSCGSTNLEQFPDGSYLCRGENGECGVAFTAEHPPHALECVPARPVQLVHLKALQPIINRLLRSGITERLVVEETYTDPDGRTEQTWRVAADPLSTEYATMMADWWIEIAMRREARDKGGLCRNSDDCIRPHGHEGAHEAAKRTDVPALGDGDCYCGHCEPGNGPCAKGPRR